MARTGLLSLAIIGTAWAAAATEPVLSVHEGPFVVRGDRLAEAKTRLEAGDPVIRAAWDTLHGEAEKALRAGPFSVTQNDRLPPSGDKHDYLSEAPYWWPDPDQPDGRPYLRRDGEVNPALRERDADSGLSSRMTTAVWTLALAYALGDDERYAAHATRLLRVWFLDDATRMNPHLNYGQGVPGRTDGRSYGIIETRGYLKIVDAVALLRGSESFTEADDEGLRSWFGQYLTWLTTSRLGREEGRHANNHATWYDAQVASFALFVGRPDLARETLVQARSRRIDKQIADDGRQPHELSRTKSFSYSVMNLDGLTTLAELGRHVEVDLWHGPSGEPSRLKSAVDYLAPSTDTAIAWPHRELGTRNPVPLAAILRRAARAYAAPEYEAATRRIPDSTITRTQTPLLEPPPAEPPSAQLSR